jgi:hypothetical protein
MYCLDFDVLIAIINFLEIHAQNACPSPIHVESFKNIFLLNNLLLVNFFLFLFLSNVMVKYVANGGWSLMIWTNMTLLSY